MATAEYAKHCAFGEFLVSRSGKVEVSLDISTLEGQAMFSQNAEG
jgi:hypothetical protein